MNNRQLSWTSKYNNNHFIIASRAYFQQSPTCSRVNNLVHITMWLQWIQHPSALIISCLWESLLVNGSGPFRSMCALQISTSSCRCSYHALFGTIPNNCSTIRIRFTTQSHLSVKVCIDVTLYDDLFYHLHNREKSLSPLVTKDNFDRCPVIHFWITLVPLDWLMARHTSGAVHSIAYCRAYI